MFANVNTMINNTNTTINKIQFHGIKTVYPMGERLACFFTVPEFCQPEGGDWIGIFPVGWTSIVRDCLCRQVVRVAQLTGPYGKVEFDSLTIPRTFATEQHYQFVYVTNAGEYIVLGTSTPFRFQPFETVPTVPTTRFNGEWCPTTVTGPWTGMTVETEMQKLQTEIVNLEQGLWQQQQQQQCNGEFVTPVGQISPRGVWQPRLFKVEQILKEKVRIEQAQRRLDQWCMLAQLKSCERHIVNVQKREPEIRDFLLRTKMQVKIAAFEQKVNQIIKMNYPTTTTTTVSPVEHYVRKYEQLLREKIQMEVEKRRVVFHKLRLTIKECERKLREIQTIDQEHFVNFQVMLKTKMEQCGMQLFNGHLETTEMTRHFETIMGSFVFEQDKLFAKLAQAHKDLFYVTGEVCGKLQELEIETGCCYTPLRIPKIITPLMFTTHPRLAQIVALEKKIAEQKLRLKLKMLASTGATNWTGMPTRVVEQLTRGVWLAPIIEKLRLVQYQLTKSLLNIVTVTERIAVEKKIAHIGQIVNTLVHYQTEVVCPSSLFDEAKLRAVLVHLKEVRERECVEIVRIVKTGGERVIGELCQQLGDMLVEKTAELGAFVHWFGQQYHVRQQLPVECLFGTHFGYQHVPAMLELVEVERKLVEMKGAAFAAVHYMHLGERVAELETVLNKRFVEKIRTVKSFLGEHVEFVPGFATVPEMFFQQQQKYEKLCHMVGELECHFVEQSFVIPTTTTTTTPVGVFGEEFVVRGGNRCFGTIHHKFMRLVQEFQLQFPECFTPKVEEIVAYLRNVIVAIGEKQQPFEYMQALKEKLVEFETILCQPECEIACLTTSIFPQSTTTTMRTQRECLKFLVRQVRELKTQVHYVLVNGFACNGNNTTTVAETERLVDMMNKRMWIEKPTVEEFEGRQTIVEATTVNYQPTRFVETIRPIEKVIIGGEMEEKTMVNNKVRFAQQQFELVDEDFDFLYDDEELVNEFDLVGETSGHIVKKEVECMCQIEKHIRKCLFGGRVEMGVEQQFMCPVCPTTSSVETRTTTTKRTTVGDVVVRRF